MGESFKIHAQALIGFEDALASQPGQGESNASVTAAPRAALEMQAAY